MTKYSVLTVDELSEGECRLMRLGDEEIGVVRVEGGYRAYRNFCPHAGAPLFSVRAGGAGYESGAVPWSVRCPWHDWEFDLRNGEFLRNRRCVLDSYRVEVTGDEVCVWV